MTTATEPSTSFPLPAAPRKSRAAHLRHANDSRALARMLLNQKDIVSMVQVLVRETGAFIAVESPRGNEIAAQPFLQSARLAARDPLAVFAIRQSGREIGVIRHSAWLSRTILDLAASIFAHPLLCDVDLEREGQRQLGAVLRAAAEGAHDVRELRGLLRQRSVDPDGSMSVIAVRIDGLDSERIEVSCAHSAVLPCTAAIIGNQRLFIMQGTLDPLEHAHQLLSSLRTKTSSPVRIGIGAAPGGLIDIRTALIESDAAMHRGLGINERAPLSIGRVLNALPTGVLEEYARILINPLRHRDERHGSELIKTLRVLVTEDFSIVRAARELFVHQNTVKYRMAQITELTGLEATRLDSRAQFWIAVTMLGHPPESPAA